MVLESHETNIIISNIFNKKHISLVSTIWIFERFIEYDIRQFGVNIILFLNWIGELIEKGRQDLIIKH